MDLRQLLIGIALFILIGYGIFKLGGLLVKSTESSGTTSNPNVLETKILDQARAIASDAEKKNEELLKGLE